MEKKESNAKHLGFLLKKKVVLFQTLVVNGVLFFVTTVYFVAIKGYNHV